MNPDHLTQAGIALYGRSWQTPLAEALDVAPRTMRAWAAGSRLPDGVAMEIVGLLREERAARARLEEQLTACSDLLAQL